MQAKFVMHRPFDALAAATDDCLPGVRGWVEYDIKMPPVPGKITFQLRQDELGPLGELTISKRSDALCFLDISNPPRPDDEEAIAFALTYRRQNLTAERIGQFESYLAQIKTRKETGIPDVFKLPGLENLNAADRQQKLIDFLDAVSSARDDLDARRKEHQEEVINSYFARLEQEKLWTAIDAPTEQAHMNPRADVLIVTVTHIESKAVLDAFQQASGRPPKSIRLDDRIYQNLGVINGASVFIVQSEMGSRGPGGALQTVEKGIAALSPSAVIMVGIAFGVDENKQAIGDILVSQRLLLYELQRVGTEDGKSRIIVRGDRPHASTRLINAFASANLYWDQSNAKVRFGLVLSGEKLVDNIDFRSQLLALEPEAIGGEMEGVGLYLACQDAKKDWILVKAICDWADGHKDVDKEQRQHLAAHNAAGFVLHMLEHAPFKGELAGQAPEGKTGGI
jgi:nucleoside phosphorylase